MTFTNAELARYQRQIMLPQVGVAGQQRLQQARVLVVGAGGLGCPVLTYLVGCGVGSITIVDPDSVHISNLHRQPLYPQIACGLPKAAQAARELRERNSLVKIIPILDRVSVENVRDLLAPVDLVIDGSDNFATKYLLNDACVESGKTLVSGSIFGFQGQVSVFNALLPGGSRGPSYRCLFPEPPPPDQAPSCAEAGVLGVLPGVVGTLQATEALKILLGRGEILSGRMLIFDALRATFNVVTFARNDEICAATKIESAEYYAAFSKECAMGNEDSRTQIRPAELRQRLDRGEHIALIDVREPNEKAEFDLGGDLIPLGSIADNAQRIPRHVPVVLYCRSGARSERARQVLAAGFGFTNLLNLQGGILECQREGWQSIR